MTIEKIIQQIAKQHQTTPEKIYTEMNHAFELAKNSTDPIVQARWKAIPHKGSEVALEDLICYIATLIKLPS